MHFIIISFDLLLLGDFSFLCIQKQLWELLPSFLNSSTDFEKSFPELAPILGAALSERPDLRLVILSSLRSALRFALQPDAPQTRVVCCCLFFSLLFFISWLAVAEFKNGSGIDAAFC